MCHAGTRVAPANGVTRTLVTGGCGYIGSHVCRWLRESGFPVVVADNLSTGYRKNLFSGEVLEVGDLRDKEWLDWLFETHDIEAVVHMAGSIVVPESVEKPLKYYQSNLVSTLNLLDSCLRHGVSRIVFSSTAAVYGESGRERLREDDPVNPRNPYARSKLAAEWMIEDLARATPGTRYVILRYFNVAGAEPGGRAGQRNPRATHLMKVASQVATGQRDHLEINGTDYPTRDGTGIRDYIHVEDLAAAHVAALQYLERGGPSTTLNCGYGRGYSVREVIAAMERVAGPLRVRLAPRRKGDVAILVANGSELRKALRWEPRHATLEEMAESAFRFEQALLAERQAESAAENRLESDAPSFRELRARPRALRASSRR